MSVVGDIVDMKVDGPTRIDFSEQVKTYDVRVLSSPLRNYFRPTKKGKEKNMITSKSSSSVALI